jgi:hypothetical protein
MGESASEQADVDAFTKRWTDRTGGSERANYALFLVELCDLIGVDRPDPAGEETERNDYVFERALPEIDRTAQGQSQSLSFRCE